LQDFVFNFEDKRNYGLLQTEFLKKVDIYISMVVWGKTFRDLFCDWVLPSQLSPFNILQLQDSFSTSYHIYTTKEDRSFMEKHSSIISLKAKMPVYFHELEDAVQEETERGVRKYDRYSKYLREAVVYANSKGAAILNLCPDALFSDSTFQSLAKLVGYGKRMVCMPGIRIQKEKALLLLAKNIAAAKTSSDSEMINDALEILHSTTEALVWGSERFSWDWPSHIIHRIDSGLLIYPFHTHPLYLNSKDKKLVPTSTLDDDYIDSAFHDPEETAYLTDSNEGFCFELSEDSVESRKENMVPTDPVQHVASWTKRHCNNRHLINFQSPFLLHSNEISDQDKNVITNAKQLAENIMNGRELKKRSLFSFLNKRI